MAIQPDLLRLIVKTLQRVFISLISVRLARGRKSVLISYYSRFLSCNIDLPPSTSPLTITEMEMRMMSSGSEHDTIGFGVTSVIRGTRFCHNLQVGFNWIRLRFGHIYFN